MHSVFYTQSADLLSLSLFLCQATDRPAEAVCGNFRARTSVKMASLSLLRGCDHRQSPGINSFCLQTISQPFTCNITCVRPINSLGYHGWISIMVRAAASCQHKRKCQHFPLSAKAIRVPLYGLTGNIIKVKDKSNTPLTALLFQSLIDEP